MLEEFTNEAVSKYVELAEKMAARGELKEAREFLDKAAPHASDRYDFLTVSALLDLKENHLPEAAHGLEEAHKLEPGDTRVANLLAETYLRSGRYEESGAVYRELLAKDPSDTACRKQVIDICLKTADYDSAWKEYQVLADGHLAKGELAEAESLMKEFLAHKPESIEARQTLADIFAKTGREDEMDRLHREMADSYRAAGLMDRAANIYRKLLEKSPGDEELTAAVASVEEALPPPTDSTALDEDLPPTPSSPLEQAYVEHAVREEPVPEPDELQELGDEGLFDFTPDDAASVSLEDSYPSLELDAGGLDELDIFVQENNSDAVDIGSEKDVIMILSEHSRPAIEIPDMPEDEPAEAVVDLDYQPEPEPEPEPSSAVELETGDNLASKLSDVDLLIKNGMAPMARQALVDLESEHPSNTAIKARNIEIAKALGDVDGFVEASIGLAALYDSLGMHGEARKLLEKAREMDPADERLKPLLGGDAEQDLRVDRNSVQYLEEVAEADFYVHQGLVDEAMGIYNRILALDPDNEEISAKLARLAPPPSQPEPLEPPEPALSSLDSELDEAFKELDFPEEEDVSEGPAPLDEVLQPEAAAEAEEEADEFFDLGAELREEFDRVKPDEAFGDARIDEVFQEFKKGVEQQLGKEDYETHYNLGIAYKEMGMLDDAINEFALAGKDPYKGFDCHSMLGLCYLEKGDYESAVEHMKMGLDSPGRGKAEYMALRYDLAHACEKMGDVRSAQSIISALYKEDAGFRDVKARLEALDRALEGAGLRPASEAGDGEGPKPVPHKKSRVSYL